MHSHHALPHNIITLLTLRAPRRDPLCKVASSFQIQFPRLRSSIRVGYAALFSRRRLDTHPRNTGCLKENKRRYAQPHHSRVVQEKLRNMQDRCHPTPANFPSGTRCALLFPFHELHISLWSSVRPYGRSRVRKEGDAMNMQCARSLALSLASSLLSRARVRV